MKIVAVLLAIFVGAAAPAQASEYPNRAIKIVVPTAAGGGTDIIARLVGKNWSDTWGLPVVIENRPGAGGNIGTQVVARAPADGYTILCYTPNVPLNKFLYKDVGYDSEADLTPITQIATAPYVLIVRPSLPVHSVTELIAYARANPGKLTWSSSPLGSPDHLAGELFRQMTGIEAVQVVYKGAAESLSDLLGGRIDFSFMSIPSAKTHVASGALRGVAVGSRERSSLLPDLPTVSEAGVPGYQIYTWYGLWAPANTPMDVVNKLQSETKAALARPAVKAKLLEMGFDAVASDPRTFSEFIKSETEKLGKVIAASSVTKQ